MKHLFVTVDRDCDVWRLRKVCIDICVQRKPGVYGQIIDRSRMFAGPFFAKRLARKIKRAMKRANIMLAVSMDPLP